METVAMMGALLTAGYIFLLSRKEARARRRSSGPEPSPAPAATDDAPPASKSHS